MRYTIHGRIIGVFKHISLLIIFIVLFIYHFMYLFYIILIFLITLIFYAILIFLITLIFFIIAMGIYIECISCFIK